MQAGAEGGLPLPAPDDNPAAERDSELLHVLVEKKRNNTKRGRKRVEEPLEALTGRNQNSE